LITLYTEAIWQRRYVKKLSPELSRLPYNKLVLNNAAESINDTYEYHQATGRRNYLAIAPASTAFASTISGASASPGVPAAGTSN
jgi:hypothetical protein